LRRDQQERNVKLGTGGIREIELITQSLQVRVGARLPQIRGRDTLSALLALCDQLIITIEEYSILTKAYLFLHGVEHKLQMGTDVQSHSRTQSAKELTACARLLG